jgi:histidinol-phosphate aminotransferase
VSLEFAAKLRRIPSYPVAQTYAVEGELAKLASNETPFGPSAAVAEAIEAQVRTLNRYPDPAKTGLREAIARRLGVPAGSVAVGNGSCELLFAAADALLEPGAEVVYAWPSFSVYPQLAAQSGARAIEVPLDDVYRHDLDAMAREVNAATRMVIVCNPNNPTGTGIPVGEIDAFVGSLPRHVAVLLDEAYVEFNTLQDPDSSLPLLKRHANLVILRTFSKVYGLAGLRVGYAVGSEDFRVAVDTVRQPFSVSTLAQAGAIEALRHVDDLERRVERTVIERVHVEDELAERGLGHAESQANFSWISLGDHDEESVMKALAERGVIVRGGKALGAEGFLRVTYGTAEENGRFLAALDAALAGA